MKDVEIIKINNIKKDERGDIYEILNNNLSKFIIVLSKAGTKRATCYHEGKNPERFPKIVVIANGEVEVYLKNIKTNEELRKIFNEPVMIKINPFIYHEFLSKTESIIIDLNPGDYYSDDRVKGKK